MSLSLAVHSFFSLCLSNTFTYSSFKCSATDVNAFQVQYTVRNHENEALGFTVNEGVEWNQCEI